MTDATAPTPVSTAFSNFVASIMPYLGQLLAALLVAALSSLGTWYVTAPAKPAAPPSVAVAAPAASVSTKPVATVPMPVVDLTPVVDELKGLRADLAQRSAAHAVRRAPAK